MCHHDGTVPSSSGTLSDQLENEVAVNQKLSYTVPEAVTATGLTRTRLYDAIASGEVQSFKAGRQRMISAKALEEFIAKLERESAGRAA